MKEGVTFIGSVIVDIIKMVDSYPPEGKLCNIGEISRCVGGCACNTSIDLKTIDPALCVAVMGMVGNDAEGKYVVKQLQDRGIDVEGIKTHPALPTSFTDVMTVEGTGHRTFFQQQGACKVYAYDDVEFDRVDTTLAHLGYALLLDGMDAPDDECGTVMARVMRELQRRGVKTSMDVVTENSNRYQTVIRPALKYADYLFLNEVEAGSTTGIPVRDGQGRLLQDNMEKICGQLMDLGVSTQVTIHAPEGGWVMRRDRAFTFEPSLRLPEGYVVGTVGAGDAFCAGMLYAILKEYPADKALQLANLAAAANLSHSNSIDGMRSLEGLQALANSLA